MNLNIILDADYIYKKLSDGKEELIKSQIKKTSMY